MQNEAALLPFLVSYAGMLGIIWARYFFVAGAVYLLVWRRSPNKVGGAWLTRHRPTATAMRREILTSVSVSLIYALPATILIVAWQAGGTAIYTEVSGLWGWLYLPLSLFVYLFLHDTYFYWTHRMMHHPRLYPAMHRTHHMSKQPTPWAAFCFHPWEAIVSAPLIPLLAFVMPIHLGVLLALLMFMTITSVTNHTGWEGLPQRFLDGPIGRHLITARHHNLHHTRFSRNYGLYFRWWDKWAGTDDLSGDPMTTPGRAAVPAE